MPILITSEIFTQHKARANVMRVLGTPILVICEIFTQQARAKAMSVVGVTLWLASMSIAMTFEFLQVIYG